MMKSHGVAVNKRDEKSSASESIKSVQSRVIFRQISLIPAVCCVVAPSLTERMAELMLSSSVIT